MKKLIPAYSRVRTKRGSARSRIAISYLLKDFSDTMPNHTRDDIVTLYALLSKLELSDLNILVREAEKQKEL